MSTSTPRNKNTISTNIIMFLFIGGLIVGLVIGVVSGYIWGEQRTLAKQESEVNENINKEKPEIPIVGAKEVFSREGEITKISGKTINIAGKALEDGVMVDKEFEIKATDDTKVQKIDVASDDFNQEDISLSDLEKGNVIGAMAADDIKDVTEFTATKIILYDNYNN